MWSAVLERLCLTRWLMKQPRYFATPRLSWSPVQYVVLDGRTGIVVSRHRTEDAAKVAAGGMNGRGD